MSVLVLLKINFQQLSNYQPTNTLAILLCYVITDII